MVQLLVQLWYNLFAVCTEITETAQVKYSLVIVWINAEIVVLSRSEMYTNLTNADDMKPFLFLFFYLLGVALGIIASMRYCRNNGVLDLEDLLLCAIVSLSSFVGITFLMLWRVCEIIAKSCGNPVIWKRKQ